MKVLVIGDSCTDKFVYGVCDRICPEAPVPVFNPTYQKANGGMAKNVFNNLVSLAKNWDIDLITNEDEITKTRLVDIKTNQMLLRVDEDDSCKRIKNDVITKLGDYDAIIISDYNKGFLTESTIKLPLYFFKFFLFLLNSTSLIFKNVASLIQSLNSFLESIKDKGYFPIRY